MGFVESFVLNGVRIKTTVTNELKKIDDILQSFLRSAHNDFNKVKVIGLDTEGVLIQNQESHNYQTICATLQLCDGTSCLIIQLEHLDSIPNSLLNFLHLPEFTFVGVGIKDNLAMLGKHYGIGCRNAVELGELAAAGLGMTSLRFCGIDELAYKVLQLDIRGQKPSGVVFKDWGQRNLSIEQAKFATLNVLSYYQTGSALFRYIF